LYNQFDWPVLLRPLEPEAYTSIAFSQRVVDLELDQSLGRTGDCYDNAAVEAFFATLKENSTGSTSSRPGPPGLPSPTR
jgi:transposase InsO family protein